MHTMTEADDPEGFGLARESPSWLRADMFETLAGINEECLELLAAQSMARTSQPHPLLRELADLWQTLDAGARRRAAACPYLIVDAGFADARRWRFPGAQAVSEPGAATAIPFFTVPGARDVIRRVLQYARELSRSNNLAARMMLGIPPHCAMLISGCTLREIDEIAEKHPAWLRPRWPTRVHVWRELLVTAHSGGNGALELARMHGVQLLAADVRAMGVT